MFTATGGDVTGIDKVWIRQVYETMKRCTLLKMGAQILLYVEKVHAVYIRLVKELFECTSSKSQ